MKSDKRIRTVILSITVVFAIFLVVFIVNTDKLLNKSYNLETSIKIQLYGLSNALEKNYSRTLEEAINSEHFIKDNVNDYLELNYYIDNNYISSVNKLLDVGYTASDINLMHEKLDGVTIQSLYYYKLVPDISEYMKVDLFDNDNLFRYLDYYNGDYYKTVLYVNIGLDKEFYTDVNIITEYDTDIIVNKYNQISNDLVPQELVKIMEKFSKNGDYYLARPVAKAFEEMCKVAWSEEIYIQAYSAYRAYNEQLKIYNTYASSSNKELIKYVSKPGFSEHHTGLAIDIAAEYTIHFDNTKEDLWLKENAHKFGFILRYPKGKEHITGFEYESWHYRYVGKEIAEYIWKNDITFEEYYEMFLS